MPGELGIGGAETARCPLGLCERGCWSELGELSEILGGGCEQELVAGTARASQPEAAEPEDTDSWFHRDSWYQLLLTEKVADSTRYFNGLQSADNCVTPLFNTDINTSSGDRFEAWPKARVARDSGIGFQPIGFKSARQRRADAESAFGRYVFRMFRSDPRG